MKPMLCQWWPGSPPDGMWCSEKLDGFRCLWTGAEYVSREGTVWRLPDEFYTGMPTAPLDGELYAGRDGIGRLRSLLNFGGRGSWEGIAYHVFDAPHPAARLESRLAHLATLSLPRHVHLVEHVRVRDEAHFLNMLEGIEARGGEGAVLRHPGHRYLPGRGWGWQKVKLQPEAA